jgi:hypothetical protein
VSIEFLIFFIKKNHTKQRLRIDDALHLGGSSLALDEVVPPRHLPEVGSGTCSQYIKYFY